MFSREDMVLVVIDYQEKLLPAIADSENLTDRSERLIRGMRVLNVPILVTQQYTKGLGETVPGISDALGSFEPVEKNTFSCLRTEKFRKELAALSKKTVAVCGAEAHICVQQTVLDLLDEGYSVVAVTDCMGSRNRNDCAVSLCRMGEAGACLTTYEALLYELLGSSASEGFREISKIVK